MAGYEAGGEQGEGKSKREGWDELDDGAAFSLVRGCHMHRGKETKNRQRKR